jgi:alkaline phosphatase D
MPELVDGCFLLHSFTLWQLFATYRISLRGNYDGLCHPLAVTSVVLTFFGYKSVIKATYDYANVYFWNLPMSQQISRRRFMALTSATLGSVVVSTSLTGCAVTPKESQSAGELEFTHGIASGDPLKDAVILWTRARPKNNANNVKVIWELAADKNFDHILRSGVVTATKHRDFTVKVDVQELQAATEYYYRFKGLNETSRVGRTKTLPTENPEQVKLAVFSCSNYPAGYFNAYHDAAKANDLDAVIHLGDYIYEYGAHGYATEHAAEIGREFAPENQGELLTLTDYRNRYAIYRTDEGLLALHAKAPFIAVWDDHEIMNDTWSGGGQNHNEGEGDFFERRAAAIQAYYEWLPIRPPKGENQPHIYRTFDFANLLSLHMLDTRVIGRDEQLSFASFMDQDTQQMDGQRFMAELTDEERTLLGKEQLAWLGSALAQSTAKWQLLGQQVLMAKMHIPAVMLASRFGKSSPELLGQLTALKVRLLNGEALSQDELAMITTLVPYNLDAWDGYPAEREKVYEQAVAQGKKLVVLAGDTHNGWNSNLHDKNGDLVGVEFATPGVTSPGMEKYLNLTEESAKQTAQALTILIDELAYCNLHQRGYLMLTISEQKVDANWLYVDNILSTKYKISEQHQTSYFG